MKRTVRKCCFANRPGLALASNLPFPGRNPPLTHRSLPRGTASHPILFFNFGWQLFAVVWLLLLWYLVLVMIKEFAKIDEGAAKLMIPYLIWLTFASYLNIAIALHR